MVLITRYILAAAWIALMSVWTTSVVPVQSLAAAAKTTNQQRRSGARPVSNNFPVVISSSRLGAVEYSSSAARDGEVILPSSSPSQSLPYVNGRRQVLLGAGGASVAVVSALFSVSRKDSQPSLIGATGGSGAMMATVSTVEEALQLIETSCDKRFLHAVVASDYQFLYEGQNTLTAASDVDPDQVFSVKVTTESNGNNKDTVYKMATTGTMTPKRAPSLWPLEPKADRNDQRSARTSRIHFAWPQDGGVFTKEAVASKQLIVDGIDCGKMSLEDALEGDMQVLVQAPLFLTVPPALEKTLKDGLRSAFLI